MKKNVILLGIKHAGKTTVGKFLAQALNLPFFDLDQIIEEQTQLSCRELYKTGGAQVFKKAETNACQFFTTDKIKYQQPAIISTGGGICDNNEACALLQNLGTLIFLDIPIYRVAERIFKKSQEQQSFPAFLSTQNPQTINDVLNACTPLFEQRKKQYRNMAHITIPINDKNSQETAQLILKKLQSTS